MTLHPSVAHRLAEHTRLNPETGCVEWTGKTYHNGYGRVSAGGGSKAALRAHRAAYELANGPIPEGTQLDHLCRNRLCCNPDHLEPVTHRENQLRGNSFSGRNARKTHCANGHEYTPENTKLRAGRRDCRTCRAIREKQRGERVKAERRLQRERQDQP